MRNIFLAMMALGFLVGCGNDADSRADDFLEEPVNYIHSIEEDSVLTLATRQRENIFKNHSYSKSAKNFTALAEALVKNPAQ